MIATLADWCGILGFFLTIMLLLRSESLRKEIDSQKREYQEQKKDIKVNMMALRDNLWDGQPLNLKIISEIRTQLYAFEQKFGYLRTQRDKQHLKLTFRMLDETVESIDSARLCGELDYFIARFERQELK